MAYICYECFIHPFEGGADASLAEKKLIPCPRDPHYWAVTETRLRCLHCGNCVMVDLHVRSWYATTAAVMATPQHA